MMPELELEEPRRRGFSPCAIASLAMGGVVLLCVGCCCLTALGFVVGGGEFVFFPPEETESVVETVDIDQATEVRAQITISEANVSIDGSSTDTFLVGEFEYNVEDYRPSLSYEERGTVGELRLRQGGDDVIVIGDNINIWNIALDPTRPLDLGVESGSGDLSLKFDESAMTRFDAELASGDVLLDLAGDAPQLSNIRSEAASGDITLNLGRDGNYSGLERVELISNSGNIAAALRGSLYSLRDIRLESDSGEINLDLRGSWSEAEFSTVLVNIDGDSGNIRVELPPNVTIDISASTDSGNILVDGVDEGQNYNTRRTDEASSVTLRLDISTDSGDIIIE